VRCVGLRSYGLGGVGDGDRRVRSDRRRYKVVCDEPAVCKSLESRIGDLFGKQPGYVVRETFPTARLIVYVIRDTGSKVDPNGYIVAIAHVQNLEALYIAQKLLVEQPTSDAGLKGAVTALINDEAR